MKMVIWMEKYYIDKERVVQVLKKLGHRVVDVPGAYSADGSVVVITDDSEEILDYVNQGTLM